MTQPDDPYRGSPASDEDDSTVIRPSQFSTPTAAEEESTQIRPRGAPPRPSAGPSAPPGAPGQPPVDEAQLGTVVRPSQPLAGPGPRPQGQPPTGWAVPPGTSWSVDSVSGPPPGSEAWMQQHHPQAFEAGGPGQADTLRQAQGTYGGPQAQGTSFAPQQQGAFEPQAPGTLRQAQGTYGGPPAQGTYGVPPAQGTFGGQGAYGGQAQGPGSQQQGFTGAPGAPAPGPAPQESAFAPGSRRTAAIPEQQAPSTPRQRPTWWWLVAAGVAVVAVVVVLGLVFGGGRTTLTAPVANNQAKPSDGAVQFMQAVAAGDSAKALSLQVEAVESPLLTDEVLRHSHEQAPISKIEVVHESEEAVDISFQMGDSPVRTTFTPVRQSNGGYKISRGTTIVQVDRPKNDSIPVLIGGVPVQRNEVAMFPGTYHLETGMRYVGFEDPVLTVSGPASLSRNRPVPVLNEQGRTAFVESARQSLTRCLKAKAINPPGCPQRMRVNPGQKIDTGSITWRLRNDPLASADPKLSLADPTQAEAQMTVQTHLSLSGGDQDAEFRSRAFATVTGDQIDVRFEPPGG